MSDELESGLSENPEAEIAPRTPTEIDPEKLAELEKRLAEFKSGGGQTVSGSENPDGAPDLTDFELDPELAHLYARGRVEDIDNVPTWVTAEHQYWIVSGSYAGEMGRKNKAGYFTRLDDIISSIINGPDGIMSIKDHGWRLSAVIPNGAGMGVAILERNVKRKLPWPKTVEKTTEVADVKDEELVRMNAEAKKWEEGEKSEGN